MAGFGERYGVVSVAVSGSQTRKSGSQRGKTDKKSHAGVGQGALPVAQTRWRLRRRRRGGQGARRTHQRHAEGDNAPAGGERSALVGRAAEIGVVGDFQSVLTQAGRPDVVGVGSHCEDAAAQNEQAHHDGEPGRGG